MYKIKSTKGYVLLFDEKRKNLVLSAGKVNQVSFPELT